jgi:predicted transcriptional regulator with HTH domain
MPRFFLALIASLFLVTPYAAYAAEPAAAVPDKPIKITERHTPIAVEYEGTDSVGAQLATRIKETLNGSNLFSLTDKDAPKLRLLLSTVAEFPSRPGVGSAYAAVWVFSQSEATLRHYLMREVGLITPAEIDGLAAKLVERTDGLAVRYGYLFN